MVGSGCAGVSSPCARPCRRRASRSARRPITSGWPSSRPGGSFAMPSWSRSSPRSAKTRRPGSSWPRSGHASCGSGCAARATRSPGAPWSGSWVSRAGKVPATGPNTPPRFRTRPMRVTRTGSIATLVPRPRTACGSPISPTCRPGPGSSTSRSSSTPSPVASSGGGRRGR